MADGYGSIPAIDQALAGALLFAGLVALATRHRGGRFRGVGGWVGFWVAFAGILVALSRAPAAVSLVLLGLLMFAAVRTYFFVAPMRPRDRYAVLAAYAGIPFALWPCYTGSPATFLATAPVVLFLLFPVLLATGALQEGMLDSLGRLFLGVLLFVYCAAHLGLFVRVEPRGALELYGILVLAAELPQRLAGRLGRGTPWPRALGGLAAGAGLAIGLGYLCGPWAGMVEEDGARAGALVAAGVILGSLVTGAVLRDLALGPPGSSVGRGAFLDRIIPPVYAAPIFFHYLTHFA
jgi:predicted CDP-diglyceride synthetase/phosphatidate cytidylyltransferase